MRPTRRALTLGLTAAALAAWPGVGGAVVTADDRTLGAARARVIVYEYASVTCPHCANWHRDVFPAFKAKYIDTGKVRFVFRELPTAPEAISSAGFMVARCAPAAKYFDVIGALFDQQHALFATSDARGWLTRAGAKGGLTADQVRACSTDPAGLDALTARIDRNLGEHQVGSTPTFVIGETTLAGEQTLAELDAVIQPLLRR